MKPNDEAKRLRDEIAHYVPRYKHDSGDDFFRSSDLPVIINKVLDAVVGATPEGINGGAYEEDDYAGGWNHALNAYEDETNKLRP